MSGTPPAPPRSALRRLLLRLGLVLVMTTLLLCAGELLLRLVDGYRLTSLRLERTGAADTAAELPADLARTLLGQAAFAAADLDATWFHTTPPPVPVLPTPPEIAARFAAGLHPVFLYQWNETLLRATWVKGQGTSLGPGIRKPDSFHVFLAPDRQPLPRYRYPLACTLPTGLTTNAQGFRGPPLATDKPPGVVRIACVGASTTADNPQLPHSYPEFLQHFLQAWARDRGLPVTFEVINAGCEGYLSTESAANVQHYVLPMAVDYVVYYEGANQLQLPHVRRFVQVAEPVPPMPDVAGLFRPAAAAQGAAFWFHFSAAARRLHTVLARGEPLAEPDKPGQELALPAGLDEQQVDLARAGEVLELGQIFASLGAIRGHAEAAGARLVLCSFRWCVHDGLLLDPVRDEHVYRHLNNAYWPLSYRTLRRLGDLQNRWFRAWAAANQVDFVDVAGAIPHDTRLYHDAIHNTYLGARCHAWALLAALQPLIRRDLASGRIPVPDRSADGVHPNVAPMRVLTSAALDAGN